MPTATPTPPVESKSANPKSVNPKSVNPKSANRKQRRGNPEMSASQDHLSLCAAAGRHERLGDWEHAS